MEQGGAILHAVRCAGEQLATKGRRPARSVATGARSAARQRLPPRPAPLARDGWARCARRGADRRAADRRNPRAWRLRAQAAVRVAHRAIGGAGCRPHVLPRTCPEGLRALCADPVCGSAVIPKHSQPDHECQGGSSCRSRSAVRCLESLARRRSAPALRRPQPRRPLSALARPPRASAAAAAAAAGTAAGPARARPRRRRAPRPGRAR